MSSIEIVSEESQIKTETSNKESNKETNNETLPKIPSKHSLIFGTFFSFGNLCGSSGTFSKTIDSILGLLSVGQLAFGITSWFTGDKIRKINNDGKVVAYCKVCNCEMYISTNYNG